MSSRIYIYFFSCVLANALHAQKNLPEVDTLIAKSKRFSFVLPDSSLQCAFRAAEISQKKNDTAYIARSYMAIGNVYDDMDDADNEIFYYNRAVAFSKNVADEHLKMEITLCLAQAYFDKGNYDEAYRWFRKARVSEGTVKDNNLLYMIYSGIGHVYTQEGHRNLDSAKVYYDKSLSFALAAKDTFNIADAYRGMNEVCAGKKKFNEAVEYLNKSLELFIKINNLDGIAQVYKDMGDIYYYTKENKKSIEYYTKAYEIQKKKNAMSAVSVGAVDLAYMYAMDGRKDLLDKFGEEGYSLALKTKSWERINYAVLWLGDAYEKTGNDKKALFYFKQLMAINDSINNRGAIVKNSREELQGAFEEKMKTLKMEEEKQKAITAEKEQNQKVVRNILAAGIVIALILLLIAFRSYVAKKKANEVISRQKEEVETQKQKIEEINKEITDSINYARIIQRSILPDGKEIMKTFPQSFGLYKPKSVVSGDFYWFTKKNDLAMIAAVDCTGHGVPGALMSMIGFEKLNEAVANNLIHPAEILSQLNKGVKTTLRQKDLDSISKDGMDIALCCFDLSNNIVRFAGAQRPLWIIRNHELIEYKSSKVSIGGTTPDTQEFISHEILLQKGDSIYLFSDGFADQFGGEKGKKIMTKNFKEQLLAIQDLSFLEQEKALDKKLTEWQGNYEQVDDILVIGIRI